MSRAAVSKVLSSGLFLTYSTIVTGREVRRVRKALGLTQVEFAVRVGVTSNTVARWERAELTVGSTAAILIRLFGQLHREEEKRR